MKKRLFLTRLFFALVLCCGAVACSDDKETVDRSDPTEDGSGTGNPVDVPGPRGEKDEGVDGVYAVGKCWHHGEMVGMVFFVSDGGRHGKILSLKQWRGAWNAKGPEWLRGSDGFALGWERPSLSELRLLWGALNGKVGSPSSSEKTDPEAQEIFNRNLERLGGMPMSTGPLQKDATYWSNERNPIGKFGTYTVKWADFSAPTFLYGSASANFDSIIHRYVYDF